MKTCPNCHEQMSNDMSFCESCGTRLNSTRSDKHVKANETRETQPVTPKKKAFNKKGLSITIAIVLILIISLFTSYQLLAKKYSAEAVEDQFKTALIEKDRTVLKELIQPSDARLHIDDDSLDAMFALFESEPSIMDEMIHNLHNKHNLGAFSMKQSGKHYGIFDRYVMDTEGYYLKVKNLYDKKTTLKLNEKNVGVLEEGESSKEIGPLLTGSYLLEATSYENGQSGEDMESITLSGIESTYDVTLDTEIIDYSENDFVQFYEEEVEEETDFFVLPNSDIDYLKQSDIKGLNSAELRIARNEIFARYGYIFESEDLQNYFASLSWYYPDVNYNGYLTEVEKHNIEIIKSME